MKKIFYMALPMIYMSICNGNPVNSYTISIYLAKEKNNKTTPLTSNLSFKDFKDTYTEKVIKIAEQKTNESGNINYVSQSNEKYLYSYDFFESNGKTKISYNYDLIPNKITLRAYQKENFINIDYNINLINGLSEMKYPENKYIKNPETIKMYSVLNISSSQKINLKDKTNIVKLSDVNFNKIFNGIKNPEEITNYKPDLYQEKNGAILILIEKNEK